MGYTACTGIYSFSGRQLVKNFARNASSPRRGKPRPLPQSSASLRVAFQRRHGLRNHHAPPTFRALLGPRPQPRPTSGRLRKTSFKLLAIRHLRRPRHFHPRTRRPPPRHIRVAPARIGGSIFSGQRMTRMITNFFCQRMKRMCANF